MTYYTSDMEMVCIYYHYQANEDADKLYDICVGHSVQTTEQGVCHCNARGYNHGYSDIQFYDHRQSRPLKMKMLE